MSLKELLETGLPLNRKERFFTGTVFPMVVCKNNFENINLLLSLFDLPETINVNVSPDSENILFFTEYSLVESLIGTAKERFKELPDSKDTPDIVILIEDKKKYLIALEAKMYDVPSVDKLNLQMNGQGKILNSVGKTLGINEFYHYLLLPERFKQKVLGLNYPVITWEDIMRAYEPVCAGDYFFELLRISLDKYDELVSLGLTFSMNCEERVLGEKIYDRFKRGDVFMVSMGREGGLRGNKLKEDIDSGSWCKYRYETSSKRPKDINRNWFLVEDFIKLLEQS